MELGVVVAGDPWRFFKDIYDDLAARHSVQVFEHQRVNTPFFNNRINRYRFQRDLESFLRSHQVVFFEWASDLLAAATQLPKLTQIVTRLHRYEMFQWANQINWENVDRIILVSAAMQHKFSQRFPEHAHKTTVIYESVDIHKFQPVDKPFGGDIGTLCFLTPRKRVYELILTYAELLEKQPPGCPPLHLHIGGSSNKFGDYTDALHGLVAKLALQDKVTFYGDVREPWEWYRHIDLFVSNSYSEGLQVAPMEAMASGRYVLSHHWDGAEELVPESQLFLTGAQLQEKIIAYCEAGEAEQRRLQEAMRARACERFDLERIKAQIRDVIDDVAKAIPVIASPPSFGGRSNL